MKRLESTDLWRKTFFLALCLATAQASTLLAEDKVVKDCSLPLGAVESSGDGTRSGAGVDESCYYLEPGEALVADLAPGGGFTVQSRTDGGYYLVELEQRGIDALLRAQASDVDQPLTVDSPQDERGSEYLLISSEDDAQLAIRVEAAKPAGLSGTVSIGVRRLDAAASSEFVFAMAARTRAGSLYASGGLKVLEQAIDEHLAAAELFLRLGDSTEAARDLYCVAILHRLVGEPTEALSVGSELLPQVRSLGDVAREAALLNEQGLIHLDLGQLDLAENRFKAAWRLRSGLPGEFRKSEAQSNLCLVKFYQSDLEAGLRCYEELQGQPWYSDDSTVAGAVHVNVGRARAVLGQPVASLEHYAKALDIWRAHQDRRGEAQALNNLALTHSEIGEPEVAIRLHSEALEIFREIGARRWEALSLHNLGFAYLGLGEARRAVGFLEEARPLLVESGDHRNTAACLAALARGRLQLDERANAREMAELAVEMAGVAEDPRRRSSALRTLAAVEQALGNLQEAAALARQAAEIASQIGDRPALASALQLGGAVALSQNQPETALEMTQDAVELRQEIGDRAGEIESTVLLAQIARVRDDPHAALRVAMGALDLLRRHRLGIVLPEFRSAFVASRRSAYELAIEIVAELDASQPDTNFVTTAFLLAEEGRAVGLQQAISLASPNTRLAVSRDSEMRRADLRRLLISIERAAMRKASSEGESGVAIANLRQRQNHLLRELDVLEHRQGENGKLSGELFYTRPESLIAFQTSLPEDAILLSFWVGEAESRMWVVERDQVEWHDIAGREEIEELAKGVAALTSSTRAASLEALRLLRTALVGSLGNRLHGRLVLVTPDGVLHRVPLAAVFETQTDVKGEGLSVVRLPSLAVLDGLRERRSRRQVAESWALVLADPIYNSTDTRIGHAAEGATTLAPRPFSAEGFVPRLESTAPEAEVVARTTTEESTVLIGQDASVANVLRLDLERYRILHIATHAKIDDKRPQLSGLLLSRFDLAGQPRDGFLDLGAIRELSLQADLAVLSACDTGLGRAVRGEGLVGLIQAFLEAGASSVIGTLWAVDDKATAAFMKRFYEELSRDDGEPALALSRARQWMRRSDRWSAPHYWAGFVYVGDWQAFGP